MFDYLTKLIKRDQNSIYHNEIISVKSSYSIVCDTDFKLTMNLCTIKASMNFSKNFFPVRFRMVVDGFII